MVDLGGFLDFLDKCKGFSGYLQGFGMILANGFNAKGRGRVRVWFGLFRFLSSDEEQREYEGGVNPCQRADCDG